MLDQELKEFIEQHIDMIEHGNFEDLYSAASDTEDGLSYPGKLTDILYGLGVDPLLNIDYIPKFYLDGSSAKEFTVPSHVINSVQSSFAYCSVPQVKLHDEFELGTSCFARSLITSVRIPDIQIEIPVDCFFGCHNLEYVDLNQVERIESQAFDYCSKLKEIFIPNTVNYISEMAFGKRRSVTLLVDRSNRYAVEWALQHDKEYRYV